MPKHKFGNNQQTTGSVKRRALKRAKRVGEIRGVNVKDGATGREARAIKRAHEALKSGRPRKPEPFDPLAPLTGGNLRREQGAAERLQFGDQERSLDREGQRLQQQYTNTGSYWDDYREALREASDRMRADATAATSAAEVRTDTAKTTDTTAQQARDVEASAQAAKLGRGPVTTEEGYRAIAGAASFRDGEVTRMRERSNATLGRMEKQTATASLGKLQALAREAGRQKQNAEDKQDLEKDKGAFRTDYRSRARQGEREWAAIQKEFKLEKRDQDLENKNNKADRALERLKARAQVRVAKLYSGADRASAEAQIKVAEKNFQGKKISRRKYVEILNRYQGLSDKGAGAGGGGNGSGPGGSLLAWERDKISTAVAALRNTKAGPGDRARALQKLQQRGIPLRLARIAWGRYQKKQPSTRPQTKTPAR